MSNPHSYNSALFLAYVVLLVNMAWSVCTLATKMESIQNALQTHVFYNSQRGETCLRVFVASNKGMLLSCSAHVIQ